MKIINCIKSQKKEYKNIFNNIKIYKLLKIKLKKLYNKVYLKSKIGGLHQKIIKNNNNKNLFIIIIIIKIKLTQ